MAKRITAWTGKRNVDGMEIVARCEAKGAYDYDTGVALGSRSGKHYLREIGFRWSTPQHGGAVVSWYEITPEQAMEWRGILSDDRVGPINCQEYMAAIIRGEGRQDLSADNPLAM